MGRNHLCEQAIPEDPAHLLHKPCDPCRPSGLSFGFPKLFPSRRQLDYVLLARPPLYSSCDFHVRLACLIHAANVRSEPGSNPSLEMLGPSSVYQRLPPLVAGHASAASAAPRSFFAHTLDFEATRYAKDRLTNAKPRAPARGAWFGAGRGRVATGTRPSSFSQEKPHDARKAEDQNNLRRG